MASPNLVLGYHGCDRDTGLKVIEQKSQHLQHSKNDYDWLGHGIYFWENDPKRAYEWASKRPKVKNPFVVGAVIDLGRCLDLVEVEYLELVRSSYRQFAGLVEKAKWEMPQNEKGFDDDEDLVKRNLDCAVINYLHDMRKEADEPAFDTIRSPFQEGRPLYEGAGFMARTHVQICVRNTSVIKGYFHPIDVK